MEGNSIFRKKSLERISSPEQLNDYIHVSNPGIWILIAAVIILLLGIAAWAIFGTISSGVTVCAISDGEVTRCYIREDDVKRCSEGMKVQIQGKECTLGKISSVPEAVDKDFEEYALHVGNLKAGEWVYSAALPMELPEGIYPATIVTEQVSPVSFIFN